MFTYIHNKDERQACAIESAIETQNDGNTEPILVIVVMTHGVLNVNGNNATRQIYDKYIEPFR